MIRIRRAGRDDVGVILAMDRICMPADSPPRVSVARDPWWIAEDDDGEPAGYAGARVWGGSESALILTRAGVLPGFRGRGLQRRLIHARVAYARRNGIENVWTYTVHTNPASSNSLISAGFKVWLPSHWGGSEPASIVCGQARIFWARRIGDDKDSGSTASDQQD